jgi:hypothetical protein
MPQYAKQITAEANTGNFIQLDGLDSQASVMLFNSSGNAIDFAFGASNAGEALAMFSATPKRVYSLPSGTTPTCILQTNMIPCKVWVRSNAAATALFNVMISH